MKCFKCENTIKNPDHNTIVLAGRKYCGQCAEEITVKPTNVEIIATPTEEVPDFPAKALSKDTDKVLEDNKIGKLIKENYDILEQIEE